ncbi:MAG: TlyA family RNA methyltransferase [Ruminococcaceae bacterium]|nr:TlyA family RNA methyltransferase [Oscillospiraceae bacterium]
MRLDVYMVEKEIVDTRSKAKKLIENGAISLDGKTITKASYEMSEDFDLNKIVLDEAQNKYVSRGGYKLEAALTSFKINCDGKVALDVGASTGGFTDCLLLNNASKVYAVDSGTAQLSPKIAKDARVVSIENYNARFMKREDFAESIDLVVMDVSFISQTLILPQIASVLQKNGELISLIKPQFEVGKDLVGKKGIVKDEKARQMAINKVCDLAKELNFELLGLIQSPIKGGDGNIEFLAYFKRN